MTQQSSPQKKNPEKGLRFVWSCDSFTDMNKTFTTLAHLLDTAVNDTVFCDLLDAGVDPGIAWNATYKNTQPDFESFTPALITEADDYSEMLVDELGVI